MKFSLAVCTRDRAGLLRLCLESIVALEIPPGAGWEVLVCNNGSTDDTAQVIHDFQTRLPLRSFREERAGKCYALSRLVREADGDWLLFLDDDVTVQEDWLAAYAEGIRQHPEAKFFCGQVLGPRDAQFSGLQRWVLHETPWVCGVVARETDCRLHRMSTPSLAGANAAFQRGALLEHNVPVRLLPLAKNGIIGEDAWMMLDQLRHGHEGWFLTGPKVTHHIPPERAGLRWYWRWYAARGQAARRLSSVPEDDLDIPTWLLEKRRRMFVDSVRGRRAGGMALTVVSVLAMCAGYLAVTGWTSRTGGRELYR